MISICTFDASFEVSMLSNRHSMHIAGQLQITNAKVLVPRTLVFGLEEAKASPWNVACFRSVMTQGKIDLRNESGRPMKVKVVGEVSEK